MELGKTDGVQTIRVAVTGDLPPLDFTTAAGEPAGFNVNLLSEISKRIGCNIELVAMDSAVRLQNLISGRVDVIFWTAIPNSENWERKDPGEVLLTRPYYTANEAYVYMDYPLETLLENEFYIFSPERLQEVIAYYKENKKAD